LAYLISRNDKNIKLVATQHGIPNSEQAGRKFNIKHRFVLGVNKKILTEKFEKFVVVSNDMKSYYGEKHLFSEDALHIIHNGIMLPKIFETRIFEKSFLIGSIGRLFPVKDYPLFVKIAHEISMVYKEIKFLLAGDGPERVFIQQLINHYGLQDSFKIIGFVDNSAKFYHDIDIYINTSLHEGIPMSILEAMAHGIPVIAANVGGIKEIITNKDLGILINSRNPNDYAEKCLMLFQNTDLRKLMGIRGRERIFDAFSVDKMAKRYYSLYKELMYLNRCDKQMQPG
jgi:glycosyltransferase involved in cell wall biosynthesis